MRLATELPVSVLMPVRNGGNYLAAAVTSILNQRGVELELLIIDDHSTDRALSKLPNDRRIKRVKNRGVGLVDALNTGLAEARFDLIARMDADDIASEERLLHQVEHMRKHPEISICGCKVKMFSESGIAEGYRHYQAWINQQISHDDIAREMFVESPIAHPSAMFFKQDIVALGGYREGDWPEDYDLWCRALLAGLKFGKPDQEALLHWRDYPNRTSRKDSRYRKQAFINCKAATLSTLLKRRKVTGVLIWGAGPTGLAMHDALQHQKLKVDGFFDINPKLQGRRKRNKPVTVFPDHLFSPHVCTSSIDLRPDKLLAPQQHLIVAVAARGAGNLMREVLLRCDWVEGDNFTVAA